MKKIELRPDPIGKQVLWLLRRASDRHKSSKIQYAKTAVIVDSLWKCHNGREERYLDVVEYADRNKKWTVHLQVLEVMTEEEAKAHPVAEETPGPTIAEEAPDVRKTDFVHLLADRLNSSQTKAALWLNTFESLVTEILTVEQRRIVLTGFLTFQVYTNPVKSIRNIATGERIMTSPKPRLRITAGQRLATLIVEKGGRDV
jgi:nucleoid DNA-binding protein